jgi:alkylhydroperoxidase family enzyme
MTKTPAEIPDRLFNELRRNFSEEQIVELAGAIAWENYRARINHAFGLEAQGFSKGSYCPMPERVVKSVAGE